MDSKGENNNSAYSYIFKFIIIGDTGVGKSCLLLQFIDDRFRLKHQPTIGVEFGAKNVTVNDKQVKLQVWDTAGQESFRSITRGYYRSAAGAILVYDIANRDTFQSLNHWLNECKTSGNSEMSCLLVGNKCDLDIDRKVTYEEGKQFAEANNMLFLETSAKSGHNVQHSFEKVAQIILNKISKGEIDISSTPVGIKVATTTTKHKFDTDIEIQKKKDGKNKGGCCGGK